MNNDEPSVKEEETNQMEDGSEEENGQTGSSAHSSPTLQTNGGKLRTKEEDSYEMDGIADTST